MFIRASLRWVRGLLCVIFLGCWATVASGQGFPSKTSGFSARPSEDEISSARIFDEPLLALGGKPEMAENLALANALSGYASRTNLDDFASVTDFLDRFPNSPWNASLRLHLGVEYYNFGYYSKALEIWEQSWQEFKNLNDAKGSAQADRALGELARMYSKLGRMHELAQLLHSTQGRSLSGPGSQLIHGANQAMWMMNNRPEISFRCGPMALNSVLAHGDPQKAFHPLITNSQSTTNGFSLLRVANLSRQVGLNYHAAFRSAGADFVVPSVVHWKAGHFAAVLERDGDRFLVKDPTFQNSLWMSSTALAEESSGYFLLPPGVLPNGWRAVEQEEAKGIYGKGTVGSQDSNGTCPADPKVGGGCNIGPMTSYTMHTMLVSLTLQDTPEGYAPPVGPAVRFTATYNQQEANQPATFYYSNMGPKWTCNWICYVKDNPTSPNADITIYVDGGGTFNFTGFDPTTKSYAPELMTQTILVKTSNSSYEWQFPDGSKKEFTISDGSVGTSRRIFLTQIVDPAGNSVVLNYDPLLRITSIKDAIGQSTYLAYTNQSFPFAITQVKDPFGRTANFLYNTSGLLIKITDILGLDSQYVYGANNFVTNLITPYGTTTFTSGNTNGVTFLEATDPLGGSELLEFTQNSSLINFGDPASALPHGLGLFDAYLYARNSFFWSKKALADGGVDYTKAVIYHFLHSSDISTEGRVLESIKAPLESRIWYNYPGQLINNSFSSSYNNSYLGGGVTGKSAKPSVTGRLLDDGTTQLNAYQYNALGNITNTTDPVGRNFSYIYATNNVDLLESRMTHNGKNELLSRVAYNSQHLPLTLTDAAGQTTTNAYNVHGQILSSANPLGELTTYNYDTNGYLLTVTGNLQNSNDVTKFSYDTFGRVRTVTDTEGYVLTFDYDAADRRTRVTHPDGTFEQFVYTNLDLVASCDRLGRWTTNSYNANRQLYQTRDPLGRVTTYDWCKCGSMTGLTDPMGHTTSWDYDVESRPIAKRYADGSTVRYVYENSTTRLKYRFDEKGQQTFYEYYPDDKLKRVTYPNATVATPTVSYTYDPDYNRLLTMQDGIGSTIYAYNAVTASPSLGAGKLAGVNGPLPNSLLTYQYDALGRTTNRAINGVAATTAFDQLGRPQLVTNSLGIFKYGYAGATTRLATESYPNGQTNLYGYYGNSGDERLQQILHLKPAGSLLSSFGYGYNSVGQITAWTNQWDSIPTRVWLPSYDAADQLTNIVSTGGALTVTNYSYVYDPAGNRLVVATNGVPTTFVYNALNQLVCSTIPTNNIIYEWDAENRLTAINNGTNRSEFYYDGLGRRAEIIERQNGVGVITNTYLWCDSEICEQRDSTGANIMGRFFHQGEQIAGVNYYYTRDHLGSVRETVNSTGTVASRYDFGPFGETYIIHQIESPDFAYSGHFLHSTSGLYLTLYRALNSEIACWLSRDPFFKATDINLYQYVENNPINKVDLFGLSDEPQPVTPPQQPPVTPPQQPPTTPPQQTNPQDPCPYPFPPGTDPSDMAHRAEYGKYLSCKANN